MSILMPALSKVRDQAKQISCVANLRQWNLVFNMYIGENNGKFYSGTNDAATGGSMQLTHEEQNWKENKTWFCPTAIKPIHRRARQPQPRRSTSTMPGASSHSSGRPRMTYRARPIR